MLDKEKIAKISRKNCGERYIKKFDVWQHLAIMLYAVIKRYDSLREIAGCMLPEARKLAHLGISVMPKRSPLSDANARIITYIDLSKARPKPVSLLTNDMEMEVEDIVDINR